ncbi:MAG: hypothetical protein ACRDLB_01990 [Actinomycetota bacterium]
MNLPRSTRLVLGAGVLLSVLLYLVILEVGLSAGKVHAGVNVQDIAVGGLTRGEAEERLDARGKEMLKEPIVFVAEGVDCRFLRREVGWGPQPFDTAERAMQVGRDGAPFRALADRLRSWIGGVTVDWADRPDPEKVATIVESCRESAASLGLDIVVDGEAMTRAINEAVLQWPPQQIHQIPIEQG